MADITPEEAAALYVWAIGDGQRKPPEDLEELKRVGRGLRFLVEHAGDCLTWAPVDLDGDEDDLLARVEPAVPGGTDDRGDFEVAVGEFVARTNERIATCHERRACPTCGRPQGLRCVRKGSTAMAGAGPPLKHPHTARWTPDVPQR